MRNGFFFVETIDRLRITVLFGPSYSAASELVPRFASRT